MHDDPGIVCRSCGHGNPEGSRFCGLCGEALEVETICSGCGEQVPAGSKFCTQCGTPVGAPSPAAVVMPESLAWKIDAGREALEGERKQITVLFADVQGSMDLAEKLDPESWRELMNRFFQVLADAVHQADGTVDKFTGDGIMALFGAPIAREDHAQCACRAALEMIDGVAALAAEVSAEGIDLAVRIGMNSGEVVVGSIGDQGEMEYTAIGHTVGLAQRMESMADAGTACLTGSTAALAEGYFELSSLGEREVKGARAPLAVFKLEGAGQAHGRLDVSRSRGLSSFVGRAAELAELDAAFERSLSGTGEVVGVVAPAGVGKSRLCHEFVDRCRQRGVAVYQAQCEPHTQDIPLVPVLQLLRSRFGITALDSDIEAQDKIRTELLSLGFGDAADAGDDLSLLFDFLGIPDPDSPAIQMNGDARNRRLRELVRQLVQATNRVPSVVLVEDLHWIDPASAVFLETLVDAIPASGGLVVANFRPEYRASWMTGSSYRQLPLAPLPAESLQVLLTELLGHDASLDGLADLIAERTGGNPFYIEEVVRELVESGTLVGAKGAYSMAREIGELPVPPTVQAILAARIDRLPPEAKATLQTAAAVGSEVSRALLTQVVDLSEHALDAAITSLIENEFIHETALYPEQVFGFRHRLTQEVAYGSQLAPARARAHTAVAIGLQATEPDRLDENSGLIAQHYAHAGDALQAAQWHLRAVFWSGLRDPMSSIRHALEVVELDRDLPEGPEADGVRLTARLYVTTMGWRVGAEPLTIRKAFDEGVLIAERNGDQTMLSLLHASFAACPLTCEGRFIEGKWIATEGARLADAVGDPGLQALSKVILIYCLWLEGRLADVVAMCDDVIELTADDPDIPFADIVANPRVWALTARAPSLLSLGRPDEAHQAIEEALALAADLDEEMLGWAHMFAATFYLIDVDRPIDGLVEHTTASAEIAERLGDAFSRSWGRYWSAYAALRSGHAEVAIDEFTRALGEIHDRGAGRESESVIRTGLGAALVAAGRLDDGIDSGRLAVEIAVDQTLGLSELWAREALASWLLDRAGSDDIDEASEHLEAGLALAKRCGNVVFTERIAELQRRLPATA
jgi:adenylate cyclase